MKLTYCIYEMQTGNDSYSVASFQVRLRLSENRRESHINGLRPDQTELSNGDRYFGG